MVWERLRLPEPAVARDGDLRRWRRQFPDTTPIADLQTRQPGTTVGVVIRIRLAADRTLDAVIEDGTGTLVATWKGRVELAGLRLGAALRLHGTVSVDADGARRMLNPAWTPVDAPYA